MRARDGARLVAGLGLLLALGGCGAYGDLRRAMDDYQPPAVVRAHLAARSGEVPLASQAAEDQAFAEQRADFARQTAAWRKALIEPQPGESFFLPPPATVARLHSAATDDVVAGQALGDGFTLETLEVLTLLRSPEVRAKEAAFRAALEGYTQAEDLDTSLRRYASFTKGLMTGIGAMTNPDPAALKFPFPGVLALKGEVVTQEAKAALAEVEIARREALTSARKAHAELRYLGQAQDLNRAQVELFASLYRTVQARYESGKAAFAELTAIAGERETRREGLTDVREEGEVAKAAIRTLLQLPEAVAIGRPAALAEPRPLAKLARLLDLAQERRQEIRRQEAMVGRQERLLSLAETMIYPGFSSDLSLFDNDLLNRGGGEAAMAGEVSFPLAAAAATGDGLPQMPWFGSNDAYLRQGREQLAGLRQELTTARTATGLGVRQGWFRWDKARRQEALYRDRLHPLAEAGLAAARQAYAAGSADFPALVQAANGWFDASLGLARAQADLIAARAELAAAVGVSEGVW